MNQQLNYGVGLFFAFIMVAVAFCLFTSRNYDASNAQVAGKLEETRVFTYVDLHGLFTTADTGNYLIVDLRHAEAFLDGHLPGAVNVPLPELLDRTHRRLLRGRHDLLLYSNREDLTVAAQALLFGQGFENVWVIPGNYESITAYALEHFEPAFAFHTDDKARFDYPRFMSVKPVSPARDAPMRPEIPQVEDSTPVAGGC